MTQPQEIAMLVWEGLADLQEREAKEVSKDSSEGLECQNKGSNLILKVIGSHGRSLSRGMTSLL